MLLLIFVTKIITYFIIEQNGNEGENCRLGVVDFQL